MAGTLNPPDSSSSTYFQILEQAFSKLPTQKQQQLWNQATWAMPHHNVLNDINNNMSASLARQVPRSLAVYSTPRTTNSTADPFSSGNLLQRSVSAMPSWQPQSEDDANGYVLYSHSAAMRKQHSQQSLQPIHEVPAFSTDGLVEYEPEDYISACVQPCSSSSLSLCTTPDSNRLHVAQLTQDSQWASSLDGSISPCTPSTGPMTPATTDGSMSRQTSCHAQFLDQVSMMRVHSDSSCAFSPLFNVVNDIEDGLSLSSLFDVESKYHVNECVDTSPLSSSPFVGSTNEGFFSPAHVTVSTSPSASALGLGLSQQTTSDLAEDMRRSASASSSTWASESDASSASASSTLSRPLKRKRQVSAQSVRKIAPRQRAPSPACPGAPHNITLKHVVSSDGSSKHVAPISKTPYIRPSHPKIKCEFCTERPEGFRGTHELERHVQRAHAHRKKGYICIDYDATASDKPFLANCKHCKAKKVYGAYYNAAAHLRRAHFHPRKRGGRKCKNGERRGGIGGGDDPPMDVLKQHWIKEVEYEGDDVTADGDSKPVVSQPQSLPPAGKKQKHKHSLLAAAVAVSPAVCQPDTSFVPVAASTMAPAGGGSTEPAQLFGYTYVDALPYPAPSSSSSDLNADMNVFAYMDQAVFLPNADFDAMAQYNAYAAADYELAYVQQ